MITSAALMDSARANTGLSDFGDLWFLGPLERLVGWVNRDAGLTAPGSGGGGRIASALSDRLLLVQYLKDNPAALDERIEVDCAVIGLPRTGSTVIHRLLSSSPRLTALRWWETAFPLPLPGETIEDPAPRQEAARGLVDYLLNEWPDFESIDPMDAMAVNEEVTLLDRTFLSTTYDSMMPIHDYGYWQADQDHEPAYRDLELCMKAIQFQRAQRGLVPRPWVFKTPHHVLGGIGGLLKVWPEVKLVMTHRNVAQVLPSYCSMCASLSISTSASYAREHEGAHWTRRFRTGLERFDALRETLPPGKVIDVRYDDTVRDPLGVARRVMTALGLGTDVADEAAFAASTAENARENRPRHKYSAEQFGLNSEQIARDFAFYHKQYL
jgi:Sulfotransferase family